MKRLEKFRQMVLERGRQLRRVPFSELGTKEFLSETIELDGFQGSISVIVEECGDGRIRIAVQGFLQTRIPRWKDVALDGFYKDRDEAITEMPDKEFYGYD